MLLQDNVLIVEKVESLIKKHTFYHISKDGGRQGTYKLFGIETDSIIYRRRYQILHGFYTFSVDLWFNYRERIGRVSIRDLDFGRLCKMVPEIIKLFAGMKQYNNGSREAVVEQKITSRSNAPNAKA